MSAPRWINKETMLPLSIVGSAILITITLTAVYMRMESRIAGIEASAATSADRLTAMESAVSDLSIVLRQLRDDMARAASDRYDQRDAVIWTLRANQAMIPLGVEFPMPEHYPEKSK